MSYPHFERWRDTPTHMPDLSVVVPTYNEEERILPTLGAFAVAISNMGLDWELIVSDDGSKDKTVECVRGLKWQNLRVITHGNTGKGGAVSRGVKASLGKMVLFADADNSTPIEELPKLIEKMKLGYEVVVGSRAAQGAVENNKSVVRHLISGALRLVVQQVSGIRIRDTQCGFKLFSRTAADRLFALQTMQGFSFDLEILYLAHKFRFPTVEVPVAWYDAPGSKVDSIRDTARFLKDMLRLKTLDRQGVYGK